MLRVWGRRNSINVQKVMWCAAELSLPVEHIEVGGAFGGLDTPEYGALNPNRRVPVIEDGDFVLWESNAIVRYLSRTYGARTLSPEHIQAQALADQWMDWVVSTVMPPMTPVFWNLVRHAPEDRDPQAIAEGVAACRSALAILDARLADRPFVLGEAFTMADIPLGAAAYRWFALDVEHGTAPNLAAYYKRLSTRPAFQEHVMIPLT
jgi:glutathione S-transferase